ncbi:MAG: BTB/POZ domain-containing protein [Caldilineaceae bacterium SB0668_bin_21]|uniref:BTB/POZ domain-containing protein n=1 Tax=Caldilineaceae bacterium SB0662_bin_9 TaxID=2605258 RepID=A0A6B1DR44_9CHLR|nr:BTB/POZ domain-containing protein [Caldilineaceae bacterium SB0668_bin_21]MYD89677.1 BTB/POZ domain-containing protein [Caldilineaceae bacterium SB0662_bin_9]
MTPELIELPERFAAFAARVESRLDRVDKFIDEQLGVTGRVESRLQAILDDLHVLKGHAPGRAARDHVETILEQLGLTYTDLLDRRDLVGLLGGAASDIAAHDRQDFFRADLVVEARAADGTACHVAVEAEYMATLRASDRARRNAGYLADRTGRPAPSWPACASTTTCRPWWTPARSTGTR